MDNNGQCVILVLLEMGLSFSGIVSNLLIVTTLRQEESLKGSTLNFLLLNLCFSNLLISFLVKPISAIYIGYAISTGEYQVGLAFCTLYTFTYRTTWCIFPFTLVAMCWCKLLAQFKCTLCVYFCCSKDNDDDPAINGDEAEMAMISGPNNHHDEHGGGADMMSPSPVPFTEIALQFGSGTVRHGGSLLFQSMTRDSLSTPTPSTTTEQCNQVSQSSACPRNSDEICPNNHGASIDTNNSGGGGAKTNSKDSATKAKHKRTLEDGPTTRQKLLVTFIWLCSAFFGVTTCFPDKVFGVEISQQILEDQMRTMIPPSQGTPRDMDLTYCTVKNGLNDLLDYLAIMVALILPFLLGPCLVGIFQTMISLSSRYLCPPPHVSEFEAVAVMAAGPAGAQLQAGSNTTTFKTTFNSIARRNGKGPGWGIIIGFTVIFLITYPIHMYVAEVYIQENFSFLFVKYCLGFLHVIFVPFITLAFEPEIRKGISTVFGSGIFCVQEMEDDFNEEAAGIPPQPQTENN